MLAIYAQHTTRAGDVVLDHDDDCTSDDHIHFDTEKGAREWAEMHKDQQGAGTAAFQRKAARAILEYLD